jgi:hypothetical protein
MQFYSKRGEVSSIKERLELAMKIFFEATATLKLLRSKRSRDLWPML